MGLGGGEGRGCEPRKSLGAYNITVIVN